MSVIDRLHAIAETRHVRLGVTDLAPFPSVRAEMERRVETRQAGSLGFTYRDPGRSTDPSTAFPWGRSLVVVAVPYLREGDGDSTTRSVARFADGDRYSGLRDVLALISAELSGDGWRCEAVFDDDRLVDRAVAVRAGVAWWGKSTMAVTPGFGPWFLIGTIVTNAVIPNSQPMTRGCGTCEACIPACPTGAIVAPGVLDARRCLAAVFQSRGAIPESLRTAAGGRLYGCDECLVACPPGERPISIVAASDTPDPRLLLSMSDNELDRRFSHWYVPGRRMRFLRRNALVALGNIGDGSDVAVLAGYVGHPDALLRQHAAWALGQIGGIDAVGVLIEALTEEVEPEARRELQAALSG